MNNDINRIEEGKFGVEMIWGSEGRQQCSEFIFNSEEAALAACDEKAMMIDELVSSGAWRADMGNVYLTYWQGITPQFCHKWFIDEDRQYSKEEF